MTIEEAQKLAEMFKEVDGGCPSCVSSIFRDAQKNFPEIDWKALAPDDDIRKRMFDDDDL